MKEEPGGLQRWQKYEISPTKIYKIQGGVHQKVSGTEERKQELSRLTFYFWTVVGRYKQIYLKKTKDLFQNSALLLP